MHEEEDRLNQEGKKKKKIGFPIDPKESRE